MTDDPFVTHRSLMFTVGYEMLGSAADAEHIVQETWLRWGRLGAPAQVEVHDPRAYLVRIVTRQALGRMRTVAREWLLTRPDVAEDGKLAERVSFAMLTVLDSDNLGTGARLTSLPNDWGPVPIVPPPSPELTTEPGLRDGAQASSRLIPRRRQMIRATDGL